MKDHVYLKVARIFLKYKEGWVAVAVFKFYGGESSKTTMIGYLGIKYISGSPLPILLYMNDINDTEHEWKTKVGWR